MAEEEVHTPAHIIRAVILTQADLQDRPIVHRVLPTDRQGLLTARRDPHTRIIPRIHTLREATEVTALRLRVPGAVAALAAA